ncbi:hypothetical protein [Methylobacterium sp. 1973]|uniref:hypothetical protein n=1 Tax=Methylobacterium sp. 1973 TaxID=3156421 RepID=UPI003393002C
MITTELRKQAEREATRGDLATRARNTAAIERALDAAGGTADDRTPVLDRMAKLVAITACDGERVPSVGKEAGGTRGGSRSLRQ